MHATAETIGMQNRTKKAKPDETDLSRRMLREARKAEMEADNSGSGFTIIKRQDSPLTRLLDRNRIGRDELQAAEEIVMVFQALSGGLMFRPVTLERRDPTAAPTDSARVLDATSRYMRWADFWTKRAKRSDPTLEIVIAAVVDERPFRIIDADLNLRNGRAAGACIAGLRDYAARAGWVGGGVLTRWIVSGAGVFRLRKVRPVETLGSMARRWDSEVAA